MQEIPVSVNPLPTVDDVYIRRIFDDLGRMQVDLDSDPLMYGPKRLNSKVALCRHHLSRCQQIFLQISDDLHKLNRAHRQAKLDFELRMQDLFANDPDVRAGKNIRDREAVATMKLRDEREYIASIEPAIQDIDAVMTVVKAKREDLKDVQGRLRDQVKLCQEEIGLGAKWGSAPSPGVKVDLDAAPRIDPAALETFNDLVGGVEGDTSISDLERFVASEMVAQGRNLEETPIEEEVEESTVEETPIEEEVEETPVEETPVEETPVEETPVEEAPIEEAPIEEAPIEEAPIEEEVEESPVEESIIEETIIEEAPASVLPHVEEKPDPTAVASASSSEIEDFFNELDLEGPAKKQSSVGTAASASVTPPVTSDIDLDDLIGGF